MTKKWQPYPTYKDSGVEWLGAIPEHWKVMPIKFALDIPITDGPHETPELYDEGIPFISAESIKNDRIDFDKKRGFISLEEHKRFSRKYKPQYGDVYMVKSGATTGNVARVETEEEFNIWSPLAVLRPNKDVTTTNFLFYAMKSKPFFYSVELSWSFGTQQNIGMGVISNIRIVLPPLPEQQKIAEFLDQETSKIDKLITKKERLIELLKEKRTALISHAVTKGLNPDVPMKDSGVEWLGKIPEHWELRHLRRIVKKFVDYRGATPEKVSNGIPLITARNIKNAAIDFSLSQEFIKEEDYDNWMVRGFPEKGDVVVTTEAPLGESAQIIDTNIALAQRVILLKAQKNKITNEYLKYHFVSTFGQGELWSKGTGSTAIGIKASHFKGTLVLVPRLEEQQKIAQFLDRETGKIDNLITKTRTSIDHLKEYRTALISAAVTGKIDVREH